MADFATLALDADSRGLEKGVQALDRVVERGTAAAAAADRVSGGMQRTGGAANSAAAPVRRLTDELRGATTGANRLTNGLQGLYRMAARAGAALGAALSIRAIAQAADAWSDLQSVVGATIGSMERAPGVMREMVRLANASYSSLGQTIEGFTRNAQALTDLGYSTRRQIDFTEALNHSLVITATRGDRAASVQNALAVAMATGRLQGDGLNTVLAHGGRVAQSLAEELGVNVSQLRQMAADGRVTAGVIAGALLNSLERVRAEAAEMPATMADGFTRISTNFTALVGTLDQMTGTSAGVAAILLSIGDNLQLIASMAAAAGGALALSYTPAILAATAQTGLWIASLITLRGVLIATGIGALVVAAGLMINALIELVRHTGGWGNALQLLGEVARGVWDGITTSAQAIAPALSAVWALVEGAFMLMIFNISRLWGDFLRDLGAGMEMIGWVAPGMIGQVASGVAMAATGMADNVDRFGQRAEAAFARAAEYGNRASVVWTGGFARAADAAGRLTDAVAGVGEFAPAAIDDVSGSVANLNDALAGTAGTARAAGRRVDELAHAADRWRQRIAEARSPLERFNADLRELNELLAQGRLTAEEHAGAMGLLREEFANAHPQINTIAQAIGDFVASGFRDFRSLADAFKRMIREMVATAIANPIRIALTTALTGGGTAAAAGTPGGGLSGMLGGMLAPGGTGFMGGLGNALGGGGLFNIAGNAAAAGGGLMATAGAAMPLIGLAIGGIMAIAGARVARFQKKMAEQMKAAEEEAARRDEALAERLRGSALAVNSLISAYEQLQDMEAERLQLAREVLAERGGLEERLLRLQGNTAELRRREIEALDPVNRMLGRFIHTMEDSAEAARAFASASEAVQRAQDNLARFQSDLAKRQREERDRLRNDLARAGQSIFDFVMQAAGSQVSVYARDLALARAGDVGASGRITQSAGGALERFGDTAGSRVELDRYTQRMMNDLMTLPAVESYQEQQVGLLASINSGIETLTDADSEVQAQLRGALREAMTSLARQETLLQARLRDSMAAGFHMLDANMDGKLTFDELRVGLSPIASEEQLRALFQKTDQNGNGTISRLEAVRGTNFNIDENTHDVYQSAVAQLAQLRMLVGETAANTKRIMALAGSIDRLVATNTQNSQSQLASLQRQRAEAASGLKNAEAQLARTPETVSGPRKYGIAGPRSTAPNPVYVSLQSDIRRYQQELSGLDAQIKSMPKFADGGMHLGGFRLVGERGPELEATGPARIHSAEDTRRILSGGGGDDALAWEVKEMRQQLAGYLREIMRDTHRQAQIIREWQAVGLPPEAEPA
jgi:tape measure domain-containing protein